MTFDDFPGWLKDQFYKVGAYIEAKGASDDIGETWLEPFIDQATSDASERAKWVIADPNAEDLGGSNLFIRAIEAGYYKNGPYEVVYMEDEFATGINVSINGRLPVPTPNGSNTWTGYASGVRIVSSNGPAGQAECVWSSGSGLPTAYYDVGQTEYVWRSRAYMQTAQFFVVRQNDAAFGGWLGFAYLIGSTAGINAISLRNYNGGTFVTVGTDVTSLGVANSTWFKTVITVTSSTLECKVYNDSDVLLGTHSVTNSDENTRTGIAFTSGSNASGNAWDYHKVSNV